MNTKSTTCITVSIPYFGCKKYIRRAVTSILQQTYGNLQLVVVNDGDTNPPWDVLSSIDDPRLIRFDLPENHGRYFCDQVVLQATEDPLFMVQDADDWSEPQRIEILLRTMREEYSNAAISANHLYNSKNHRTRVESYPRLYDRLQNKFEHRASHFGLFRVEALQKIGGFFGGFRIGYDTLLMNLLQMTGHLSYVKTPLYTRTIRPGSLTTSAQTGMQSPARRQAAKDLAHLYAEILPVYRAYVSGEKSYKYLIDHLLTSCNANISDTDRTALKENSQKLQQVMERQKQNTGIRKAKRTSQNRISSEFGTNNSAIHQLLDDPRLPWNDWTINRECALYLYHALQQRQPKRILETGSGISTVIMAYFASQHKSAQVTSLEHDTSYRRKTTQLLQALNLSDYVDCKFSKLTARNLSGVGKTHWYDVDLQGKYDFVFIDGPPMKYGRHATFFMLHKHLIRDFELWLHNANRAHEQQCLNLWHDHFPVEVKKETIDKGLFIITPQSGASNIRKKNVISKHAPKTNGQLGITLLTGCRPNLLQQTLHALEAHMLPLLHSSYVVVLLNSDDTNSKAIIDKLTYVDKCIMPSKSLLSIGKATSLLMQEISSNKIVRYVLHLEDDWLLQSNKTQTIENACTLLAEQKNIGQVRLRLSAEKVLPYHMVTRKPIVWEPQGEFLHTTSAHFTFNPHLIRCSDIAHIYPCETEKEAQQHFLELRSATAQHTPGLFKHNGENGQSLRMRENGRQSQVLLQSTMVDQIKEYGNSRPITTFSKPKVSCLMPTANRRDFVPLAIRNFQAQTYKNLELIILDDGRDSVADLIPDDPCIHYHRVQGKMQIGKKRNRICELANGEIFIHWDDDDWHRRDRIKLQVDALLYSGKALCGIATMYFWDQQARKAWQYVYPAGRRHWVAGGSLCYWRKTWEHTPFPEIRFGEDTRFVWNRNACDIHVMQDNTFYVGRIHDHNTCKKMTNSRYWHPVDLKRIQEIMDSDFKEKIENTAKC